MTSESVYPVTLRLEGERMLIVVPFIHGMIHPETREWALLNKAIPMEVWSHDDEAYHRLLQVLWDHPDDLMIVEQDNVPPPGVVEEFSDCPALWCTCPYPTMWGTMCKHGLGCVKFSAGLKKQMPSLIRDMDLITDDGDPPRVWWRNDARITTLLTRVHIEPHWHSNAKHHHDYGGCSAR